MLAHRKLVLYFLCPHSTHPVSRLTARKMNKEFYTCRNRKTRKGFNFLPPSQMILAFSLSSSTFDDLISL